MKYSKSQTLNHMESVNKPECLKNLNDLIIKEGYDGVNNVFDNEVTILDLDCVESKNAMKERRTNRSSMDCTFAIEDEITGNVEMLLVELRFNYVNMQNLTRRKLLDKVSGSRIALGSSVKINDDNIFIFKSELKEQAKSRLFRMLPKIPNNYLVMDMLDLKATYLL
jgi:hypothetical protein